MRHLISRYSQRHVPPRPMEVAPPRSLAIHETRCVRPESLELDAQPVGIGREQEYESVWVVEPLQDGSGAEAVRNEVKAAAGQPARDS